MVIMRNLIYIFILATMASCVVPRNYPKAKWKVDKIVDKWPEVLENDTTIVKFDTTVVTPEAKTDTVVRLTKNDTIYIEKEKLKIRVIRGKRDSIYINAECEPDTIRINVIKKIPVYSIEEKNLKTVGGINWWWIIVLITIGISILIGVRYIRKRFYDKS